MIYGVIDFRALSFPDLSMGEIPPQAGAGMRREQRSPIDKSEEKTSTEVTDGRKCNPTGSVLL